MSASKRPANWTTPARLAVGRALLDGPLAESKIATAVGRDPANVHKMLQRMRAEELVEVEHEGRPRLWRLTSKQDDALSRRLAEDQPSGRLLQAQRIVAIKLGADDELKLASALRSRALLGALTWVARVEGADTQYLFVLDRQAPALQIGRLVAALTKAGIRCERMLVEELQSPDGFFRSLRSLRDVYVPDSR